MNTTLVLLKPDCYSRGLMGEVIKRIEQKGYAIVAMRMEWLHQKRAEEHYAVHKDQPFFENLVTALIEGPIVVMAVQGEGVIEGMRRMLGSTFDAQPGTIRGDFCHTRDPKTLVHASDSPEAADWELSLYFHREDYVG